MTNKTFTLLFICTLLTTSLFGQNYERYKKLKDTIIVSKYLGFEKKISVTVPIEWQKDLEQNFPLIIVFGVLNGKGWYFTMKNNMIKLSRPGRY